MCTDLDGTLLNSDFLISKENIDAIEYFKNEGGYFTFVTGRMPSFVSYIYETINPNAPFGCINGGGIYDHRMMEYRWTHGMSDSVIELVEYADRNIPGMGIQINTFDNIYFSRENSAMEEFRAITGVKNVIKDYHDIGDELIAKIVFADHDDEKLNELIRILKEHPKSSEFDYMRSEKMIYEILPRGINKGTSVTKLSDILGVSMDKTIAVGDYDNDIGMLRAAKIGFAVSNACDRAKAAADLVTVSNDEHAIAKIIYDLDCGIITI